MNNRQIIFRLSGSTQTSLSTPALIFILYLCFNALLPFYSPSLSRAEDRGEVIDDSGNQSSSRLWWGDLNLD